jgi:SAM-dependent methyltransferase
MTSFSDLTPAEKARQLGTPDGEMGLAVGEVMNRMNGALTEAVYDRLHLEPGHRVLEIGFGNGHLLPSLMRRAEGLHYVGLDISATMNAEARRFNARLIAEGSAEFHLGTAEALAFDAATFNRVFAVNVYYFWPTPLSVLTELRRMLRQGGFCLIAATDQATAASTPFARLEHGFHVPGEDELRANHAKAGFGQVALERFDEVTTGTDGSPWHRGYNFVIAAL